MISTICIRFCLPCLASFVNYRPFSRSAILHCFSSNEAPSMSMAASLSDFERWQQQNTSSDSWWRRTRILQGASHPSWQITQELRHQLFADDCGTCSIISVGNHELYSGAWAKTCSCNIPAGYLSSDCSSGIYLGCKRRVINSYGSILFNIADRRFLQTESFHLFISVFHHSSIYFCVAYNDFFRKD